MSEKSRTRTLYAPEEKAEIIMAVLTRKTTIQKVAKEKNVAPTLISLWKKQAEDAIMERFVGTRPGRRKVEACSDDVKEELRVARIAARTAKTRATRLEGALKTAKTRIAELEQGVRNMAAAMGCKLAKAKRPRRKKD
ncbi:MAG: transposase [Akkermansia sp.]|nr:transposase [Akkermansia sp.]